MNNLEKYGLSDRFSAEATMYIDFVLGRVIAQYSDLYNVVTEEGELLAKVSGKYEYNSQGIEDFPVVGDFVMLDRSNNKNGNGVIHKTLTRKSSFKRKAVGSKIEVQIIAANIDIVFICMAMNNNFNLRRLERYIAVAWDSGATPIILLTKSDLCSDTKKILEETENALQNVDILVTSSMDESPIEKVLPYLKHGITASFIGSSGVGKSTIINKLMGEATLATHETRNDDKGRHTTTHRELLVLPQGGIVIDTPGMRELGIEAADISKTFLDIDKLHNMCRFSNCSHTTEPGCAIQEAIASGELDVARYESYKKLQKELAYNNLKSKQIENEKINRMFGSKKEMKQKMDEIKSRKKRN